MTWDPVFNALLKQQFNCVSSEEFSENGKYKVDRLKSNLMALGIVGCGLGDKWEISKLKKGEQTQVRPNATLGWFKDVVQKEYQLPLLLKGILHPDDAKKAVKMGVDGIIVSNHGGRQVDGSISTIEALPGT